MLKNHGLLQDWKDCCVLPGHSHEIIPPHSPRTWTSVPAIVPIHIVSSFVISACSMLPPFIILIDNLTGTWMGQGTNWFIEAYCFVLWFSTSRAVIPKMQENHRCVMRNLKVFCEPQRRLPSASLCEPLLWLSLFPTGSHCKQIISATFLHWVRVCWITQSFWMQRCWRMSHPQKWLHVASLHEAQPWILSTRNSG